MRGIVDQIINDIVVIEINGKIEDIPKEYVADDVKVNDSVVFVNGVWVIDPLASEERSKKIKTLMNNLWED